MVVAVSILVLIGAAVTVQKLGSEFLPQMDDGRVMVKVRLPTGASVWQTSEALRRIEALIADDPLIESYFTLVGGKVWGIYTYLVANEGEINVQASPAEQAKIEHQGVYEPAETLSGQDFHPGWYGHGDNTPG